MKKYLLATTFVFLLSLFASNAFAQSNLYSLQNCQNGACTTVAANLPPNSTGIDPNTTVSLNFSVYTQPGLGTPQCPSGKNLFHTIQHDINGDTSNYEYLSHGSGSTIDYNFNSLSGGNQNRYYGIFYCWTQMVTDKSSLQLLLGNLGTQGQVWQTPEFNLTTRNTAGLPQAIVDNSSPALGATISISLKNGPSYFVGHVTIANNSDNSVKDVPISSSPFPLAINSSNGFTENGSYTLTVTAVDNN